MSTPPRPARTGSPATQPRRPPFGQAGLRLLVLVAAPSLLNYWLV
jgi:hypothetical protein